MTEQQKQAELQQQAEIQRRVVQRIGQMVIDQIAAGVELDQLRARLAEAEKRDGA